MAVLKASLSKSRLTRVRLWLTDSPAKLASLALVVVLASGMAWAVPRAAQSSRLADRAAFLLAEESSAMEASARASAALTAARVSLTRARTDLDGLVAAAERDGAAIKAARSRINRLELRIQALRRAAVQVAAAAAPVSRIQPLKFPEPKWCVDLPDVENSCYD